MFADLVYLVQHRQSVLVKSFYYSTALSFIFTQLGIDCSADFPEPLGRPIDEHSLRRCLFDYSDGEWVRVGRRSDQQEPSMPNVPPASSAAPATSVPLLGSSHDAQLALILEQLQGLHSGMANIQTGVDSGFAAVDTRLTCIEDRLTTLEKQHHSLDISLTSFRGEWLNDQQRRARQMRDDDDAGENDDELETTDGDGDGDDDSSAL